MLFFNIRYGIILFQVMSRLLMCSETFQTWHQEILTDWKGTLTPKTQTGKQNYDNKGYAWQLVLHTSYQETIEGSRRQRWLIPSNVISFWSDKIVVHPHAFFVFCNRLFKVFITFSSFLFCCCCCYCKEAQLLLGVILALYKITCTFELKETWFCFIHTYNNRKGKFI